jgi:hypothetical protein
MTWTILVAHVRAAEQYDEREARRQIGHAIADGRLFARWADKPTIPPMPGSEFSFITPRPTMRILAPDDAPPLEATYWLECIIDPSCPDRVLEPPIWVNVHTAMALDQGQRFRKPIFQRDHVLHLWPARGRVNNDKREPLHELRLTKPAFREEVDAQYQERITTFLNDHQRYPTREEDRAWGKGRELTRIRIDELRARFLPEEIRKGGRPKNLADAKLVKK